METRVIQKNDKVLVSPEWWDSVQTDIGDAIEHCNDIVAALGAHKHTGKYGQAELLEIIDGYARDIRKLLEAMHTPL